MAWLQFHILTGKRRVEYFEGLLEQMGALSVTLADAGNEPILELGPGETRLWRQIQMTALFPGDQDADFLRARLTQALGQESERALRMEYLQDQPWERVWLQHFKPMRFGERLWIRPTGTTIDDPDALTIDLDPGLAFGTGPHPTTALCLEWLDQAALAGKEVIDFGCGSGILAIAALKLGAAVAHGVDHDPQAILASRDNAERNRVGDRLRLYGPDETLRSGADLILANILSGTLIKLSSLLADMARPQADLLLSGILESQAEEVLASYRPWFDLGWAGQSEGWVLLHGKRLG